MSVVRIVSAISAATAAVLGSLLAAPGDVVPQSVLISLAAVSAGLSAFVAALKADDSTAP